MTDPLIPRPVSVEGDTDSVAGDTIRITAYSGSTARGTVTGVLDSNKKLVVDLANTITNLADGDTIVASENGKALGSNSGTLAGGADISIEATTVAFPTRSL